MIYPLELVFINVSHWHMENTATMYTSLVSIRWLPCAIDGGDLDHEFYLISVLESYRNIKAGNTFLVREMKRESYS